jgi:hypothetical protein
MPVSVEKRNSRLMAIGPRKFPARGVGIALLICAITGLNLAFPCCAQEALSPNQRQAKDEAIAALPLGGLNSPMQRKINDVIKKTSLYRRLPATTIEADQDYFRFLVRNPEVIVEIWRLMGVTQMTTERIGPYSLRCDDGAGTISDVELVYGTDNLHLFYGSGSYSGSVIKRTLQGECVMLLRTENRPDANSGKNTVSCVLDVFLKIDNSTAGLVAKTLQPIVGRTADHNFVESMKFVQRLNETTSRNGPGVQGMADRLTGLSEPVRYQFVEMAGVVYQRTQLSNNASMLHIPVVAPFDNQSPVRGFPTNFSDQSRTQLQR